MSLDYDSLISFLNSNTNLSNITIQFSPEYQKNFQEDFYIKLKQSLPKEKNIYIIGDTSYGKCCCDEAAAMHLKSDIIIRVGHSCFTQNKQMPIYYLIENKSFSNEQITQFKSELFNLLQNENKNCDNVILFYNEKYQKNLINKIQNDLKEKYNNISFAEINIEDYDKETHKKIFYKNINLLYGREIKPKSEITKNSLLVYIGDNKEEKLLIELSLRYINTVKNIIGIFYNDTKNIFEGEILPKTFSSNLLFRRFNLIEKAKECYTFGILIGGLNIPSLNNIINLLKSLLESENKKVYTFLLGKITDEKLGNFIEYIDAFILIGCPFNEGYSSKAIDKPILAPLDIKFAFDENYEWDGFYSYDVDYILINDNEIKKKLEEINENKQKEIDEMEKKMEKCTDLQKYSEESQALAPIFSMEIIEKYDKRKFKGLQIKNDEDPEFNEIRKVVKGKVGIPIKYQKIE